MVVHETYRKANGDWADAGRGEDRRRRRRAPRDAARHRRADRDRRRSRRCRSRSATPSTPTTSSANYGADTARWFMLSDSPPERDVIWTEEGVQGAGRFVQRLWRLVREAADVAARADRPRPADVRRAGAGACARPPIGRSRGCRRTSSGCASTSASPTSTSSPTRFQASLASLETEPTADYRWAVREAADILVRLFHPMMPHLAEECWAALGHKTLVAHRALAGARAGPAGRGHHHTSGPDQWQEARRCHSRPQCDECRDRGCRFGARCGKTGARRQAAQKSHRGAAEDRQCGGMTQP